MNVDKVKVAPQGEGREIRARARTGGRKISVQWSIDGSDPELEQLINYLMVKIRDVEFVRTGSGYEIEAHMTIANRSFLSTWVVDADDTEMRAAFEGMMGRVDRQVVREMQGFLAGDGSGEAPSTSGSPGRSDTTIRALRIGK